MEKEGLTASQGPTSSEEADEARKIARSLVVFLARDETEEWIDTEDYMNIVHAIGAINRFAKFMDGRMGGE